MPAASHAFLEFNSAHAGQSRVQQQASCTLLTPALAKLFGRRIVLCIHADSFKQIAQPFTDGRIIIHDEDRLLEVAPKS